MRSGASRCNFSQLQPTAASVADKKQGCKYIGVSSTPIAETPVLAVDPAEAARLLGLSRPMIYKLMQQGKLRTVTIGRSRRVPITELERLLGVGDAAPTGS